MIEKVLIANRGEIALRINRACKEMGLATVAAHSTADANAMHVRLADESVCIGPAPAAQSYLNIPAILSAATITGADAIHPGYGFLSENAKFAHIVEEHGLVFIGPSPKHIEMMGDKITAKETMRRLGVPVVPGSDGAVHDLDELNALVETTGFPVLIKAAGGGGGKGMRVARDRSELAEAFTLAKREAQLFFGNDALYVERYLERPRHIELQIIADNHGNVVHLGERDCSLQRSHQKVLEEAPSPALNVQARQNIGARVVEAISELGYRNAGTIEFLYEDGEFFFLEMNTRLQVEHPVTEMVTGLDLVREQVRIATEAPLSVTQQDVRISGHAIECRINAENPRTFAPSPGRIAEYHPPGGFGVRVDSALYSGYQVPSNYDSMVGKLIVHGNTRNECLMRLRRALDEYVIEGIETTIELHRHLATHPDFVNGTYDIHWLERHLASLN